MGAAVSAWRPALYPIPWALTPFDHFFFARPIAADVVNWPLADYRYGGVFFQKIVHTGVDIPAEIGTPVLAAGSGKVTWAGYGLFTGNPEDTTDPYGMAVLIRHDFSYQDERLYTLYGHLDHLEVARGQFVSTGDLLGQSGMTGKTTGPHLHFEVRLGDGDFFQTRNPELWLVPPQGWGVLAGRVMNSGGRLLEAQLVSVRSQANRQVWRAYTYTGITVYSDTYYQENMAISDLPSGRYEVETLFEGKMYRLEIEILPGLVSYFSFRGRSGYSLELPPQPGTDFSPP
jgi:murein DD-endopeptidase MepM/ murein hydrolase activator NlpD